MKITKSTIKEELKRKYRNRRREGLELTLIYLIGIITISYFLGHAGFYLLTN